MPTTDKASDKASPAPVLAALVRVHRKVNTSHDDARQYVIEFGAAEDDRNREWSPDDMPPVFPLNLAVSGEVGDALDVTKTYRLTLTEAT